MNNVRYSVNWRIEFPPSSLPVEQVCGFLYNDKGLVLLLNDVGLYNLPGGHPEKGEDWLQTLTRECLEEVQAEFSHPMLLGHVHVEEMSRNNKLSFAQVRFVAAISGLLPQTADPATGKCYGREFHPPERVAELLPWGNHGLYQLRDAQALWQIANARRLSRTPVPPHNGSS